MKKIIRSSVFETNSSSTHSLSIMRKEDYDHWVNGEFYWNDNTDEFLTYEEVVKYIEDSLRKSGEYKTLHQYMMEEDFTFSQVFSEYNFFNYRNNGYDIVTADIEGKDGPLVAVSFYGEDN